MRRAPSLNITDRQRRAFIVLFMTPGTLGQVGKVMGVSFGHPLLRAAV